MPLGMSKQAWFNVFRFDPEKNLGTPTAVQSTAGTWTLGEISDRDLVLAFDAIFPATPDQGCLAEKGGSGIGFWCGLKAGGTYFRVRAGSGGSAPASNISLVDIYDFPQDDAMHTVVVEIDRNPGGLNGLKITVWIDGELKGTDTSTATSAAGTGSGVFLSGGEDVVNVTGEPKVAWPGGTAEGEARFYDNKLVT